MATHNFLQFTQDWGWYLNDCAFREWAVINCTMVSGFYFVFRWSYATFLWWLEVGVGTEWESLVWFRVHGPGWPWTKLEPKPLPEKNWFGSLLGGVRFPAPGVPGATCKWHKCIAPWCSHITSGWCQVLSWCTHITWALWGLSSQHSWVMHTGGSALCCLEVT